MIKKTNRKLNILISSVGKRVELVQILKKTMKPHNIKGKVIGIDVSKTAPALYFCDSHYIVHRCDSKYFINDIIEIANNEEIDIIVPTIDTELPYFATHKHHIESKTISKIIISDIEVIETFYSKNETYKFFKSIGLQVPKVYSIKDKIKNFPIIIKPDKGSSAHGIHVLKNKSEFENFLKGNNPEFIQEFIEGKEITVDILTDFKGKLISVCMRERIRIRDGEVQIGKTVYDEKILKMIKKLCKTVKFVGGSTVQIIKNETDYYFIECNPRFGGGLPFAIYAGANHWEYLIKRFFEESVKIQLGTNYKKNKIFSRYDQTIEVK